MSTVPASSLLQSCRVTSSFGITEVLIRQGLRYIRTIRHLSTAKSYTFLKSKSSVVLKHPNRASTSLNRALRLQRNSTMSNSDQADLIESAKKRAAQDAVAAYFFPTYTTIGIGSGSTVAYIVDAIKETLDQNPPPSHQKMTFVPTGTQSKNLILKAGLHCTTFDQLSASTPIDVSFDGADEVDQDFNLVKGGGACLFQEKLVASRARKFVCVADFRKDSHKLLTNWEYVPVEVAPFAAAQVLNELARLGCPKPEIRTTGEGDGKKEVLTDQGFWLVKAPFPQLGIKDDGELGANTQAFTMAGERLLGRCWQTEELAREIKAICGVLEVGLFVGCNGPEAEKQGGVVGGGQKPVAV